MVENHHLTHVYKYFCSGGCLCFRWIGADKSARNSLGGSGAHCRLVHDILRTGRCVHHRATHPRITASSWPCYTTLWRATSPPDYDSEFPFASQLSYLGKECSRHAGEEHITIRSFIVSILLFPHWVIIERADLSKSLTRVVHGVAYDQLLWHIDCD